jgi:hypothetical protein
MPEGLKQLPKLISLLGSTNDAEVLAAARAINRLLKANGITWHDLAAGAEGIATGALKQQATQEHTDPFDPSSRGEQMMQRWRARRHLAERWLNDPNFYRLPKAWQGAVQKFVKSTPHALGSIEKAALQRVEARLGSWAAKDDGERRPA